MRTTLALLAALIACNCSTPPATKAPEKRVSLRRVSGTSIELIPAEGQAPYCLAYTVAKNGPIRQLTMSEKNLSFSCPPGIPIGKRLFKIPAGEGPVKVYVFFTSLPVQAGSLSQQILEAPNAHALQIMNMRLPGQATLESLDFAPEEDEAALVGGLLGDGAGAGAATGTEPAAGGDAGPL